MKGSRPKNPSFNLPNQKSFYSQLKIEEIILSYNILIELYVMINKFSLILYLRVSKS